MRKVWMIVAAVCLLVNGAGVLRGLHLWQTHLESRHTMPELVLIETPKESTVMSGQEALRWKWNMPVVESSQLGKTLELAPGRIDPGVEGTWRWRSDRELEFLPDAAWEPCQRVHVHLDTLLTNAFDMVVAVDERVSVQGQGLKFLRAGLQGHRFGGDARVVLDFNQNVPVKSLRTHLKVRSGDKDVSKDVSLQETPRKGRVLMTVPSVEDSSIAVELLPGLRSVMEEDATFKGGRAHLKLESTFTFVSAKASGSRFDSPNVFLKFSTAPDLPKVKEHLRVKPEVRFSVRRKSWYEEGTLLLSGEFDPGKRYAITLREGMPGLNGATLKEDRSFSLTIPPRKPGIAFRDRGEVLPLTSSQNIGLKVVGEKDVHVSLRKVFDSNRSEIVARDALLERTYSRYRYDEFRGMRDVKLNEQVYKGDVLLDLEGDQLALLPLKGIFPVDQPGFYSLDVKGKVSGQKLRRFVLLSDLGMIVRRSEQRMLVWVTGLSDGQVRPNTKVSVWSDKRQKLAERRTDDKGFVELEWVTPDEQEACWVQAASENGDFQYVLLNDDARRFPVRSPARSYANEGQVEVFVRSDRGIYRPGETLHLQAIARGNGIARAPMFPMELRVKGPSGTVHKELVKPGEWGNLSRSLELKRVWPTGSYRVTLAIPGSGGKVLGETSVRIASFVPPTIAVKLDSDGGTAYVDSTFRIRGSAAHLYGSPAKGLPVKPRIVFEPENFTSEDFPRHSFSDTRIDAHGLGSAFNTRYTTDDEGNFTFPVSVGTTARVPSAIRATVTVSVQEFSGRTVSASIHRRVDLFDSYLGIELVEEGESRFVDVVLVDQDGKLLDQDREVEVGWEQVDSQQGYQRVGQGRWTYVSGDVSAPISKQMLRLQAGRGRVPVDLFAKGQYRFWVRDGDNSSCVPYTLGTIAAGPSRADAVELSVSEETLKPGAPFSVQLKSIFDGKALVTVESDRVHSRALVPVRNGVASLELIAPDKILPNIWVRAVVLRPLPRQGEHPFVLADGATLVHYDLDARKLSVAIDCPAEHLPGRKVPVRIQTQPHAKVLVAAVDEGILQLTNFRTPDPFAWFTAARRPGVEQIDRFSDLLPDYARQALASDVAMGGGGGPAGAIGRRLNPFAANRFESVAWWSGEVQADAEGVVDIEADFPEFAGKVRWMVVAVGPDGVGHVDGVTRLARPVTVQQGLPRFLAPGDRSVWTVRVHNRSADIRTVQLNPLVKGPLDVLHLENQTLTLDPGASQVLRWDLEAKNNAGIGTIELSVDDGVDAYTLPVEMSVRPTIPFRSSVDYHLVKAGDTLEFSAAEGWLSAQLERKLIVSRFPGLMGMGALEQLIRYPYGCLEQTTSSSFPLLYVRELVQRTPGTESAVGDVTPMVEAGIFRLYRMQRYDGSFAYWTGGRSLGPVGTGAYALEFLTAARDAGYRVEKQRLDSAFSYLESWLQRTQIGTVNHSNRDIARVCALLAAEGKLSRGWAQRLVDAKQSFDVTGQIYAARALRELGEIKAAREMIVDIPATLPAENAPWYAPSSIDALLMLTLLELSPDDERIHKLWMALLSKRRNGRWENTYGNAMALRAISEFSKQFQPGGGGTKARIEFAGDDAIDVEGAASEQVPADKVVRLTNTGDGAFLVMVKDSGFPTERQASRHQMLLRQELHSLDGKKVDLSRPLQQGQPLVCLIEVDGSSRGVSYLAIDLPLPAGLEPAAHHMQSTLRQTTRRWPGVKLAQVDHMEVRDDRVLFFPKKVRGKIVLGVLLQAVTPGEYQFPGAHLEHMYDEDIQGDAEGFDVVVE